MAGRGVTGGCITSRNGKWSEPSGFDPILSIPLHARLHSSHSIRPFRAAGDARARHPLKEDDRLEDTQAPANGFVLLASIGIKRIASSRYVSRNEDDNDVMEGGGRRSSYITRKEINIQWIFQIGILDEVMKLYFVTNVRKC